MAKLEEITQRIVNLLQQTAEPDLTRDVKIYQELFPLLQELRLQSRVGSKSRDLNRLTSWLLENGIKMDKFEFREGEYGCGVFATEAITANSTLLEIPQKLMITSVPANDRLKRIIENDLILGQTPNMVLILRIIQEYLNPNSFWAPYLQSLPTSFNIPLFYSPLEMEDLKGLSMYHDAIRDVFVSCKNILHLMKINEKYSIIENSNEIPFALFEWARAIAQTRQNPITVKDYDKEAKHLALIPLYDMFNHKSGHITAYYDPIKNTAVLDTAVNCTKGSEIFMSYGNRPNQLLFLHSGFVDENNYSNDCLKLNLAMPTQDKFYGKRVELLKIIDLKSY